MRNHSSLKAATVSGLSRPDGRRHRHLGPHERGRSAAPRPRCAGEGPRAGRGRPRVSTARPIVGPRARQSIQATEYRYSASRSAMRAMQSSRSAARSVSTSMVAVSTGSSRRWRRPRSRSGPCRRRWPRTGRDRSRARPRRVPAGVASDRRVDVRAERAVAVVVLAVDVGGDGPPDGDVARPRGDRDEPARGTKARIRASRLTPAPTRTTPASRSASSTVSSPVMSSTMPPAYWAASPYERARPRATTLAPVAGRRPTGPGRRPHPSAPGRRRTRSARCGPSRSGCGGCSATPAGVGPVPVTRRCRRRRAPPTAAPSNCSMRSCRAISSGAPPRPRAKRSSTCKMAITNGTIDSSNQIGWWPRPTWVERSKAHRQ